MKNMVFSVEMKLIGISTSYYILPVISTQMTERDCYALDTEVYP